jgi:molybdenum cofactor cytidylyltransferase
MVAVVILAAGASTRSGPVPKALLPVGPHTVLTTLVRTCEGAGLAPILVVTGAAADEVGRALQGTTAIPIPNPRWEHGRTGSVQVGLRAAASDPAPLVLWPVDHPFVRTDTIRALVASVQSAPNAADRWTIPTHRGHRGHPIALGRGAAEEVLTYPENEPLFRYPRTHPERVQEVAVEDAGVLENIDTPSTFAAARDRWLREVTSHPDPEV